MLNEKCSMHYISIIYNIYSNIDVWYLFEMHWSISAYGQFFWIRHELENNIYSLLNFKLWLDYLEPFKSVIKTLIAFLSFFSLIHQFLRGLCETFLLQLFIYLSVIISSWSLIHFFKYKWVHRGHRLISPYSFLLSSLQMVEITNKNSDK